MLRILVLARNGIVYEWLKVAAMVLVCLQMLYSLLGPLRDLGFSVSSHLLRWSADEIGSF